MPKTKPKARRTFHRSMQDKRYRKTEEAIIEVLLKSRLMPSTKELTQRARISRSTLYRHHRAIPGIIPDYEREILAIFKREIKKTVRQEISLEGIYLKMLIFILRHKRVFGILFRHSGDRIVENMVLTMKKQIADACHLAKNSEKILRIYAKEVAGIIEAWGGKGFPEHEISQVQKDILYLTTTMRQRLTPVNH